MHPFIGFEKGMGIGGWLTNYKRFNCLPQERRLCLTVGDYEHFENYITEKDVRYIRSLGMDHIRLGFDQIVVEERAGVLRENIVAVMERFVGWCEKYGLHIVFNLHKAVGNYCDIAEAVSLMDDAALQERFVLLWETLEERFADKPAIAFELLNEVRDVAPEKWNRLAEKTVAAIRKKNKTRKIILGSTCWNAAHTLKDLRVFDDGNVVYTFHVYEPFAFTHQRGVLMPDPLYYNREMPYPADIERYRDYERVVHGDEHAFENYDRMDCRYMEDVLAPAAAFIARHPDKILWCGEFGTIRHCRLAWRENWMRDVITFLKKHEIPYCVWNYLSTPNDGNRFSLVDDDTRKILSRNLAEIIKGNV